MYLDPFVAGVLTTLLIELSAFFLYAVIVSRKRK